MTDATPRDSTSAGAALVLFFGLLAICFALGYPALARYDPREAGNFDSDQYYRMVAGRPARSPMAHRVLTPALARGVLTVVSRLEIGSWDPVLLALLAVNSAFAALSALMLMQIGRTVARDPTAAALAPLVYLSSYVVVNHHLAGLVDAGEGFFLTALMLALLRGRWMVAPLLLGVGALAKETVVPLGLCGMAAWWLAAWARGEGNLRRATAAMGLALVAGLLGLGAGRWLGPAAAYPAPLPLQARLAEFAPSLVRVLFCRAQVYAFLFLVPMGLPRLRRIPLPLLAASLAMAAAAALLGAFAQITDNLNRPLFNALAPVLVVSSCMLLSDLAGAGRLGSITMRR